MPVGGAANDVLRRPASGELIHAWPATALGVYEARCAKLPAAADAMAPGPITDKQDVFTASSDMRVSKSSDSTPSSAEALPPLGSWAAGDVAPPTRPVVPPAWARTAPSAGGIGVEVPPATGVVPSSPGADEQSCSHSRTQPHTDTHTHTHTYTHPNIDIATPSHTHPWAHPHPQSHSHNHSHTATQSRTRNVATKPSENSRRMAQPRRPQVHTHRFPCGRRPWHPWEEWWASAPAREQLSVRQLVAARRGWLVIHARTCWHAQPHPA